MSQTPHIDPERIDQNRIIDLLGQHHEYHYIGNLKDVENDIIREDTLRKFLMERQGCSDKQANDLIRHLRQTAVCSSKDSLKQANQKVYDLIRDGYSVSQGLGKFDKKVHYINWGDGWKNNIFEIAEEVTVRRVKENIEHRRPDVVIYVNGLPLVVIELKRAKVSVTDGIHQNIRNQGDGEICHFFAIPQMLMAANVSEGVYYGTTLTPASYYLKWKDPVGEPCPEPMFSQVSFPNDLDRGILSLLEPQRMLDFIHDLIVFDGGVKKIARPNQYFALKAAQERILKKESGIIWHSQGSGKSLTMVWLAQWIFNTIGNARIIVVTDRDELDKQIVNGFADARQHPVKATSGTNLIGLLDGDSESLICTLVHKFGVGVRPNSKESNKTDIDKRVDQKRTSAMIMQQVAEEIKNKFPNFKAKGEIFVFVDECHRTQGGILNKAMKEIVGKDVMMIGFTGTPLLKKDKPKKRDGRTIEDSQHNFGSYIHTYKFDEAVSDGVILDLRYSARDVEQQISNPQVVDKLFESYTKNLKPNAKELIKVRWAKMQNLFSSKNRIDQITVDIAKDYDLLPALEKGWGNAILVADSVLQALRYWNAFQSTSLKGHCAAVTSYGDSDVELSEGYTEDESEKEEKVRLNTLMLGDRDVKEFEEWAKNEFIKHPADMKLLIVVSKLLTGFDAPSATYIYLDKKITDHDLFQAICRVNRVNGEDKDYGYIVDYKDLFNKVKDAITDYTNGYSGGAFSEFDEDDVKGLLTDQQEQGKKDLTNALEVVEKICENVESPKGIDQFKAYFVYPPETPEEEQVTVTEKNTVKRQAFYDACKKLVQAYVNIANYLSEEEANKYRSIVNGYNDIRVALMLMTGENFNYAEYDAKMRKLLDNYVNASSAIPLTDDELDDFSFLDLIKEDENGEASVEGDLVKTVGGKKGVSETLAANVRRVIRQDQGADPVQYQNFSERINKLLADYKQEKLTYVEYLKQIKKIVEELKKQRQPDERLDTPAKISLYHNLGEDVDLALTVHEVVETYKTPNFRTETWLQQPITKGLRKVLNGTEYDVDTIMKIIIAQSEF